MKVVISKNALELGIAAAHLAGEKLREAVAMQGEARVVLSTGMSQFETLDALLKEEIDWEKIEVFHLDEYIGIPVTHKASFRKYLHDRFVRFIKCKQFYGIDTEDEINKTIANLSGELIRKPVDLGIIGIGANGHIAFNDPPADFDTREPYIEVTLDDNCKEQQVNEGWFNSLADVPGKAVSMSVWQIMQCKTIVTAVPHHVKADAVYNTFTSSLSPMVPATMLKHHGDFNLFLDVNSAARIITF